MSASNSKSALSGRMEVDRICDEFEQAWKEYVGSASEVAAAPRLEDHLASADRVTRSDLLRELLGVELFYRKKCGEPASQAEYLARFPEQLRTVQEVCRGLDRDVSCRPLPSSVDPATHRPLLDQRTD